MSDKKTYSLTQLSLSLKKHFVETFGNKYFWVVAELVKHNIKSGHHYIELADSVDGQVSCKMQANLWSRSFDTINANLNGEANKILSPGNKVLLKVTIEYHELYGTKLNIVDLDPSITYGEVEKKKTETIHRLKEEGIYKYQKSIYLPIISKRIVIVGSEESSGVRDFINKLETNNYFRNFKHIIIHTTVQGDKASNEIVTALKNADQYNADVVVLVRGGGSKMDLNIFNDYEICKTICNMRLPVMTGIGHESDEVVADFVARYSCITPTAVAEKLYSAAATFRTNLETFEKLFKVNIREQLTRRHEYLELKSLSFGNIAHKRVSIAKTQLQDISYSFRDMLKAIVLEREKALVQHQQNILSNSHKQIEYQKSFVLVNMETKMFANVKEQLGNASNLIEKYSAIVTALDPNKLLKNGYSVATIDGKSNYKLKDLKGKEMKTFTNQGIIYSTVTKTEQKDGNR